MMEWWNGGLRLRFQADFRIVEDLAYGSERIMGSGLRLGEKNGMVGLRSCTNSGTSDYLNLGPRAVFH